MRIRTAWRPVAIGVTLLATASLCRVFEQQDSSSSSNTSPPGSEKAYCEAVKSFYDFLRPFGTTPVPADQRAQLVDELTKMTDAAPAEVRNDLNSSLAGDTYARDNVDFYNKTKCQTRHEFSATDAMTPAGRPHPVAEKRTSVARAKSTVARRARRALRERRSRMSASPLAPVYARHPAFLDAVLEDARVTAAYRTERHQFNGRRDAIGQAVRLSLVSDAFLAQVLYRAKASLQAAGIPVLPRVAHRLAMTIAQVCIGDPVSIGPGLYLPHGQVVIDGVVEVGDHVTVRPWVTIGLKDGDFKGARIGPHVRIGTGAKIIGPIHIGEGAHIGANAVVLHDVPAHRVAVGMPARVIDGDPPGSPSRRAR